MANAGSSATSSIPPWPFENTDGVPATGAETLPSLPTMRSAPAFSLTSMRPSGRKVMPQGKVRPLATVVVWNATPSFCSGARVWPAKAGL